MKLITTIALLLGLTTPAFSSVCPNAVGLEISAQGKVVKSELDSLLTKLISDKTPQARLYARAVKKGQGCPPKQCASVLVITRQSIEGPAESAAIICKGEMI